VVGVSGGSVDGVCVRLSSVRVCDGGGGGIVLLLLGSLFRGEEG
jgi:hypothetical protein